MRLPLRQVRLLDDLNEIVLALDENRSARLSGRRISSGEAFAFHRSKDSREHTVVSLASPPVPELGAGARQTPLRRSDELLTSEVSAQPGTNANTTDTNTIAAVTESGRVSPSKAQSTASAQSQPTTPRGFTSSTESDATLMLSSPRATPTTSGGIQAVGEEGPDKEENPAPLVLVVEDNAMNRKLLSQILFKAGYQYETAENGEFALQAIQRNRFDAILMVNHYAAP
jgi:hypothetical protein